MYIRGCFWVSPRDFILELCLCCEWPCSFCFQSCDLWSLGVIIYVMLCGYPPFYSRHHSRTIPKDMRRKIMTGSFEFPEEEWSQISEMAKDVVRKWVPRPLRGEAKEALKLVEHKGMLGKGKSFVSQACSFSFQHYRKFSLEPEMRVLSVHTLVKLELCSLLLHS